MRLGAWGPWDAESLIRWLYTLYTAWFLYFSGTGQDDSPGVDAGNGALGGASRLALMPIVVGVVRKMEISPRWSLESPHES